MVEGETTLPERLLDVLKVETVLVCFSPGNKTIKPKIPRTIEIRIKITLMAIPPFCSPSVRLAFASLLVVVALAIIKML